MTRRADGTNIRDSRQHAPGVAGITINNSTTPRPHRRMDEHGKVQESQAVIRCSGHPLVRALHRTTLEITRDQDLSPQGDCIIAVGADLGARDLPGAFRDLLCRDDAHLHALLTCGTMQVEVRGRGSSAMTLDHPTDLVWRRSRYVCGRTVAIESDTTARTLPREFVTVLQQSHPVEVVLTVTVQQEGDLP